MKRLALVILILSACARSYPVALREDLSNPMKVSCAEVDILVYIETEKGAYSAVGIHPAFGRDFFVRVEKNQLVREEYGRMCSKSRVHEIISGLGAE
jgi:hypothetical protein